MKTTLNSQKRLDALLKRQVEIREALRAEKEKRKASEEKDHERLALIVGRALLDNAARFADFDLMLRGVLKTSIVDGTPQYNYLKSKGWL